MINQCHQGDCRDVLRKMIAEGVTAQMCVTSPPYWGLRDYGVAGQLGLEETVDCLGWATGEPCGECFICNQVEVFRLVREALADDGTLWLNMGDAYAGGKGGNTYSGFNSRCTGAAAGKQDIVNGCFPATEKTGRGLKPKDLIGQPWRLAFALQADGWYLRQDIIWHKPNPMPESVKDRCTKSHEYIFLLSKSARYYFDQEAIKEPANYADSGREPKSRGEFSGKTESMDGRNAFRAITETRNKRSVWTVGSEPFKGAHFATFPTRLIEPCILAGSRPGDVVLDIYFGSGTTGQVAENLGRQWIGSELNPEYFGLQRERIRQRGLGL